MKSLAAIALLAGSAVAGSINGLTFPDNFPGCGNTCVSQTTSTSNCFSSGDFKACACKLLDPANYAKDPCVRDNCSPDEVPGVVSGIQMACGVKASDPQTSAKQHSSSAATQQSFAVQQSSASQESNTAQATDAVTSSLLTSIVPSSSADQPSKTDTSAAAASKTSSTAAQPTKSSGAAGVVVGGMAVVAAAALAL